MLLDDDEPHEQLFINWAKCLENRFQDCIQFDINRPFEEYSAQWFF